MAFISGFTLSLLYWKKPFSIGRMLCSPVINTQMLRVYAYTADALHLGEPTWDFSLHGAKFYVGTLTKLRWAINSQWCYWRSGWTEVSCSGSTEPHKQPWPSEVLLVSDLGLASHALQLCVHPCLRAPALPWHLTSGIIPALAQVCHFSAVTQQTRKVSSHLTRHHSP